MATIQVPTLQSSNDALQALKLFCEKVTQTLENLPTGAPNQNQTEVEFDINQAMSTLDAVSSRLS